MASFAVSQGDKKETVGQNFGNYLRKQGEVGLGGCRFDGGSQNSYAD